MSDVHFCRVLGAEDMCARDSIYAATKQTLNLNVGEPRTVRMIYFLPNDRPFQSSSGGFDESDNSPDSDLLCGADAGARVWKQDFSI